MIDFDGLFDHLKLLYESGLYEDVKVLADLIIGYVESTTPTVSNLFSTQAATSSSSSFQMPGTSSSASSSSTTISYTSAAQTSASSNANVAANITTPIAPPIINSLIANNAMQASSQLGFSPSQQPQQQEVAGGSQHQQQQESNGRNLFMVYYYFGSAAFNLNEYKMAESIYNKALQVNRTNTRMGSRPRSANQMDSETEIEIKYNLHLCFIYDKKHLDALKILESIPVKQRSAKILLALGKLNQTLANTKEAIANFKDVLKISKFSIVALEALLNLGVKLDELPKSAVQANSEWLNIYLKGKSNLINREYKEAIKTFKAIDTSFTHKSMEVLCSLATSYYLNGEYSNAISSFEKLHRLEPTYTSKMDVYAFLLFSDKSDYDKLSVLEKLANDMHQTSISIPETWTVIGYYSLKKKSQKAKCFAENALLIDRENVQALLLRAISLGKLKALSESAVTYREATRINIYFYEAYKGLVETLLNINHIKEAVQVASSSVKLLGSNHRTLALYGEALSRDSQTQEKSKNYLYKAIKGDPDNQEAVVCLVRVCMTLSQFSEALEVLGKYIRHNSSNPRLMHIYSELMKKCNKADEAVIYMNKASGMDPNNLQIKTMLEKSEQSIESNQDETIQNFHAI